MLLGCNFSLKFEFITKSAGVDETKKKLFVFCKYILTVKLMFATPYKKVGTGAKSDWKCFTCLF